MRTCDELASSSDPQESAESTRNTAIVSLVQAQDHVDKRGLTGVAVSPGMVCGWSRV